MRDEQGQYKHFGVEIKKILAVAKDPGETASLLVAVKIFQKLENESDQVMWEQAYKLSDFASPAKET